MPTCLPLEFHFWLKHVFRRYLLKYRLIDLLTLPRKRLMTVDRVIHSHEVARSPAEVAEPGVLVPDLTGVDILGIL